MQHLCSTSLKPKHITVRCNVLFITYQGHTPAPDLLKLVQIHVRYRTRTPIRERNARPLALGVAPSMRDRTEPHVIAHGGASAPTATRSRCDLEVCPAAQEHSRHRRLAGA